MSVNYGCKRVVTGAHYGLRDWLAQRVTAAVMALGFQLWSKSASSDPYRRSTIECVPSSADSSRRRHRRPTDGRPDRSIQIRHSCAPTPVTPCRHP